MTLAVIENEMRKIESDHGFADRWPAEWRRLQKFKFENSETQNTKSGR